MKATKLPPYDAVRLKHVDSDGSYKEYKLWRKSQEYIIWRNKQWKKQDGRCAYCRMSLIGKKTCVEHVLPQWLKTRNINSGKNLVLACVECNKKKGSKILRKNRRPRF